MAEEIDLDQLEQEKAQRYFSIVMEMYPDVEVGFLESKCIQFAFDSEGFNNFVADTMLGQRYPKQLPTTSAAAMNVEKNEVFSAISFLEKFPNPVEYFSHSDSSRFINHSLSFLQDSFRFILASTIKAVLKKCNYNLYTAHKKLKKTPKSRKTRRADEDIVQGIGQPPQEYYDEVAFILHEDEILAYQTKKEEAHKAAIKKAREDGTLNSCECCFSEEVLTEEIVECPKGHRFCKDCIKRSSEVWIGDGLIDFPCLEICDAYFKVEILKNILPAVSYEKILRKLQEREVAKANIPGLVGCPFCEYCAILDDNVRIFSCLSCKKSSCRLCRKESHIPYKCSEVSDRAIQNRTFLEEKMTEALVRNCYKCGSKFIREDGCNKVTCKCGAQMCYLCRLPVKGYAHFKDESDPTSTGTCPLWTNNNDLHEEEVEREAELAIQEIKRKNPDVDVEVYKKLRK